MMLLTQGYTLGHISLYILQPGGTMDLNNTGKYQKNNSSSKVYVNDTPLIYSYTYQIPLQVTLRQNDNIYYHP